MLVLLPLRLWAGALMPMTSAETVQASAASATQLAHSHHASAATPLAVSDGPQPDLHETGTGDAHALHSVHAQSSAPIHIGLDASLSSSSAQDTAAEGCHEGPGCMACAVCHLSADLPDTADRMPVSTAHTLTASVTVTWLGHAWPPLIKPPIL